MPSYYFHLDEGGSVTPDLEGRELPSIQAAREMAIREARSMLAHEIVGGHICFSCHIEIVDEQGRPVDRVTFNQAVTITGYSPNIKR
jgi:hypothetical protein